MAYDTGIETRHTEVFNARPDTEAPFFSALTRFDSAHGVLLDTCARYADHPDNDATFWAVHGTAKFTASVFLDVTREIIASDLPEKDKIESIILLVGEKDGELNHALKSRTNCEGFYSIYHEAGWRESMLERFSGMAKQSETLTAFAEAMGNVFADSMVDDLEHFIRDVCTRYGSRPLHSPDGDPIDMFENPEAETEAQPRENRYKKLGKLTLAGVALGLSLGTMAGYWLRTQRKNT